MQFDRALDPRFGNGYISWKVFTRKQMENICKLEKLPFRDGMTCNEMEIMLTGANVNPFTYKDILFFGVLHNSGEDRPKNLEQKLTSTEVKLVIEDVNFDAMKMYELRQECNLQAIPWKKTDKKVELIAKLKDKMNVNNASSGS